MNELAKTFFGLCLIVAGAMVLQSQERLPEPTPKFSVGSTRTEVLTFDMSLPKATPREIQRFADRICQDKYKSEYLTEKSYECL